MSGEAMNILTSCLVEAVINLMGVVLHYDMTIGENIILWYVLLYGHSKGEA
jgi:hypothetical protein